MVPVLEGMVARRLLVNFRLDPVVAQGLLPRPLEPLLAHGRAVASLSLVRLEHLRPRGLAPLVGLTMENMAHRIAVSAPAKEADDGRVPGIYVLRRDTESRLVATIGGRLFAGEHRLARFEVEQDERHLRLAVRTEDGAADVDVEVEWGAAYRPSPSFPTLAEAQRFFESCECGYGAGVSSAVHFRPIAWHYQPVGLGWARARYFENEKLFPKGSVELDSAVAARSELHELVEVKEVPEILEEPLLPQPA